MYTTRNKWPRPGVPIPTEPKPIKNLPFLYRHFGLCFHKWGKWSKPFTFGFDAYQRKVCEICEKTRQRHFGYGTHKELYRD